MISSAQMKDPVTGDDLNTFDRIIDMQIGLGVSEYVFDGVNQTLADLNGDTVDISGSIVRFVLSGGARCIITIEGAQHRRQYTINNIAGTRTQTLKTLSQWVNGSLGLGYTNGQIITDRTSGVIINQYGRGQFVTTGTHALEARRTDGDGYVYAMFNTSNALIGGIRQLSDGIELKLAETGNCILRSSSGSPEGSVTAGVGSICVNRSTGVPYFKLSGTGNTGWVALPSFSAIGRSIAGAADAAAVRTLLGLAGASGWAAPTGTATRTAFDTSSVTLPDLAERVKALIDDLTSRNLLTA
jgi:hypothetical protein